MGQSVKPQINQPCIPMPCLRMPDCGEESVTELSVSPSPDTSPAARALCASPGRECRAARPEGGEPENLRWWVNVYEQVKQGHAPESGGQPGR